MRLLEVLAALSLATDLGSGFAPEKGLQVRLHPYWSERVLSRAPAREAPLLRWRVNISVTHR